MDPTQNFFELADLLENFAGSWKPWTLNQIPKRRKNRSRRL
jgi:hypothetical protein